MSVRIITQAEVPKLLQMADCIRVMRNALKAVARGDSVQPLRSMMWLPDKSGLLGMMPSSLADPPMMGIKVVSFFPRNHGTRFDSHQGAVMLFETTNGQPRAIIDATSITAIRTAAVSAVATDLLARPDAGDLALIGTGVQAGTHLEALASVRKLTRVRAYSLSKEATTAFCERYSGQFGVDIEAMPSARETVLDADLICTVTSSKTPVLEGAWIAPGSHINAVGACLKDFRELDTAAVQRASLYVDSRESAVNEAGDYLIPLAEGAIDESHIRGEIGELLLDRDTVVGRSSSDEVTLFKSLGLAVEDLAAAHHIHAEAERTDTGLSVELGGTRD